MGKKQFKVGDFVRFLNEKQEGIVQNILSENRIIVLIEDGFPIEVSSAELVFVQSQGDRSNDPKEKEAEQTKQVKPELQHLTGANLLKNEICIAVIPTEGQISSGPLSIYLINSCEYDFVYTLHAVKGHKRKGFHYGAIPAQTNILLDEMKREDIFDTGTLIADLLIYNFNNSNHTSRIHQTLEIPIPDLSQSYPKLPSPLCFTKVVSIFRVPENPTEEEGDATIFEKLKSEFTNRKNTKSAGKPEKIKSSAGPNLSDFGLSPVNIEVDLHIEELIDDITHLNTAEIFRIQMDHFRKELDQAILRHHKSIIFIHGIGNGKLKAEIRKELKTAGLKFNDGTYHRYGGGATEVLL